MENNSVFPRLYSSYRSQIIGDLVETVDPFYQLYTIAIFLNVGLIVAQENSLFYW